MARKAERAKTFINPSGILEHVYIGNQSPEDSIAALKTLERYAKKIEKQGKPVLILADVSQIPKIDLSNRQQEVRKTALRIIKNVKIKRAAVYGPLKIQLVVNMLALISGQQERIKVFSNRVEALRWLKEKN